MPSESFGQRLRQLRMDRKLSSKNLAEDLHITLPYLSQLEADLAIPSEPLARSIASYFKVDQEDFVFLARRLPAKLAEIREKFPNASAPYFRKVQRQKK